MIREVGESIGRAVLDGIGRAASRVQESKPLPVDLLESDDAYLAVFDAPGARAGDVTVQFQGDTLSVRIDRLREFRDGYEMRFPGRGLVLAGRVTLPDGQGVRPEAAEATLTTNGTLEVLIPKDEQAVDIDTRETHTSEQQVSDGPLEAPEAAEDLSGADIERQPGEAR